MLAVILRVFAGAIGVISGNAIGRHGSDGNIGAKDLVLSPSAVVVPPNAVLGSRLLSPNAVLCLPRALSSRFVQSPLIGKDISLSALGNELSGLPSSSLLCHRGTHRQFLQDT